MTDTVHGLLSPAGATVGGPTSGGRVEVSEAAGILTSLLPSDPSDAAIAKVVAPVAGGTTGAPVAPGPAATTPPEAAKTYTTVPGATAPGDVAHVLGSSTTTMASLLDRLGLAQHPALALATSGPRDSATGQPAAEGSGPLPKAPTCPPPPPAPPARRAPASPSASSWHCSSRLPRSRCSTSAACASRRCEWRQLAFVAVIERPG